MLLGTMKTQELELLIKDLSALPKECEWVEFKLDNTNPHEIGEYISALSNSACYHKKDFAWLVTQLNPRIDVNIYEFDINGLHFAVFKIQATHNTPVSFRGEYFIRVGSYKKRLYDHPEREREIWRIENNLVFENGIALDNATEEAILQSIDYPSFFDLLKLRRYSFC